MKYPMLMSLACGERRYVSFHDGPDQSIYFGIYVLGTEDFPVWLSESEARFVVCEHHNSLTFEQSLNMARLGKTTT